MIVSYFDKIFSRCQCGFRKGFSTQHILLTMIEKLKISCDNKQFCTAILTDLSKALDCIPFDLLIAKLNAYGFDQVALKLIHSYLCHKELKSVLHLGRNQIFCVVFLKGQYLVHCYSIQIYVIFFIDMSSDIANYADDTTPYECVPYYYDKLKENLELTIYKIFSWFKYNNFKANANVIFYYRPISVLL